MGFKKPSILSTDLEISVPMIVHVFSGDAEDVATVTHIFKIPSTEVREQYTRLLVSVKGRRIKRGSTSEANWYLWRGCIIRVEGYDDLPLGDGWHEYFNDTIGRIHVDSAVTQLMDYLGGEEAEQEKKFVPSSEQSSGAQVT